MVGLYPPGTYVRLSDRRVGMVTHVGKHIDRPEVIILNSQTGELLTESDQYKLDMSDVRQQSVSADKLLLDYMG